MPINTRPPKSSIRRLKRFPTKMPIRLPAIESTKDILENLLKRSPNNYGKFEAAVDEILNKVKTEGDAALFAYTKEFDKTEISADTIKVTEEEIKEAYEAVDPALIDVIRKALVNIRSYHEKQRQNSWFTSETNGTMLGQKVY